MQIKKGFTLIELLVVVAIIAVLIAILLPALSSAKAMAVKVQCGANLKTSLTAARLYALDYNEGFPFYFWGYTIGEYTWANTLVEFRYFKDPDLEVFRCPYERPSIATQSVWVNQRRYVSYGVSTFSSKTTWLEQGHPKLPSKYNAYIGIDLNKLEFPSAHILMADCAGAIPGDYWFGVQFYQITATRYALIHLRHRNAANIGFADGHVEGVNEGALNGVYRRCEGEKASNDWAFLDNNLIVKPMK